MEKGGGEPASKVCLFTDGACLGNPGRGGWAFIITGLPQRAGAALQHSGAVHASTSNRMELQAAIEALRTCRSLCPTAAGDVRVTTDSRYLQRGASVWLPRWKANQWRNAAGRPVKNLVEWKELDLLASAMRPTWHWVKGHSQECAWHARADRLARMAARGLPASDAST